MPNPFPSIWAAIVRIDLRAWFTAALFALVWRIIEIIAARPSLLENASFMQLVGPLCGAGGILLIASFLYGSNKEGADKTSALADNAKTLTALGVPLRRKTDEPVPVVVVPPDYGAKSDVELIEILTGRGESADDMTREQIIERLHDLDNLPKEPPHG